MANGGATQETDGGSGGFPWDLVLQVVGAVAALAAWVTVVGGARVWARLHAAHIPETQTLAALPKDLYLVVGLQTLLLPLILGATVSLLAYLSRPLGSDRAGVPGPVGSPAAPPPDDPYLLRDWFTTLRPVRVVSRFIGRHGRRITLVIAGAIAVGVAAIMLAIADADGAILGGSLLVAAAITLGATVWVNLPTRGALVLFGLLVTVAILVVLSLTIELLYVAGLLLITVLAAWLTLGLVADKGPGLAALSLFFALAIWSGALLFAASAGARDPRLQPAQVHLKDRVEQGFLLGRTGDLLLLAQDTETPQETRAREAGTAAGPAPARTKLHRQVLVLADDDIDHVVIGGDTKIAVTVADEGAKGTAARDPQPAPTPTPSPTASPSATPTPTATPDGGGGGNEPEIPPLRDRAVVMRADGYIDGVSMQFQVMELRRQGEMLVLDARVVSRDDPKAETDGVTIGDAFDDGKLDRDGTPDYSVDGIVIVDPFTSRSYALARDSRHGCTCTTRLRRQAVAPGRPFPLVAFYNAPDAGSQKVDITVPGFEPLIGVPIQTE